MGLLGFIKNIKYMNIWTFSRTGLSLLAPVLTGLCFQGKCSVCSTWCGGGPVRSADIALTYNTGTGRPHWNIGLYFIINVQSF